MAGQVMDVDVVVVPEAKHRQVPGPGTGARAFASVGARAFAVVVTAGSTLGLVDDIASVVLYSVTRRDRPDLQVAFPGGAGQ
jgi:hypothetical protein